jgi:hypothetical protein
MSWNLFVHLRYILVLNVLAGLVPSLVVKGREHDPLMNARWWTHEYHSAVLVVSIAALAGTVLVYVLMRREVTRWWAYCLCGALVGVLPGLFYLEPISKLPEQDA